MKNKVKTLKKQNLDSEIIDLASDLSYGFTNSIAQNSDSCRFHIITGLYHHKMGKK